MRAATERPDVSRLVREWVSDLRDERDSAICQMRDEGATLRAIAKVAQMSPESVRQIVARRDADRP